jgi:hypothetical protein
VHHLHERAAKEEQRRDRQRREQEKLHPQRARGVHEPEAAHDERSDAEENDVKAARRRQLQSDQHEPENQPMPPQHE